MRIRQFRSKEKNEITVKVTIKKECHPEVLQQRDDTSISLKAISSANKNNYSKPLLTNRASIPGFLPRKFTYISIASSIPPGVRIYLRNLSEAS